MLTYIEVEKIDSHPDNPRKDLGDITELAESIKARGIMQNLTVVPWFSTITRQPAENGEMDGYYRAVIGHRRLAAAKLAGLKEVLCIVSDMKPNEQVATMLLENMQRNDLTAWEQAQGIQTMLNLGETVGEISEKTGFSKSTIRKRIKWLELDGEQFKASVERGASLQDYAELDKIESITLKNRVLEKIGTSNFQYELKRALDQEKQEKQIAAFVEKVSEFATQVDTDKGYRAVKYYTNFDKPEDVQRPEDVDKVEYFFLVTEYGYIRILKKDDADIKNVDDERARRDAEATALRERKSQLDEISKRAFELRVDFIKGIGNAKKHSKNIMLFAVKTSLQNAYTQMPHGLDDLLDFEVETELDDEFFDEDAAFEIALLEAAAKQPEKALLVSAYTSGADSSSWRYYDYSCEHIENKDLDSIYDFLGKLGYKMSDDESALRDGTHSLFTCEVEQEVES